MIAYKTKKDTPSRKIQYMRLYRQRGYVKEKARIRRLSDKYKAWQKSYGIIYRKRQYGMTLDQYSNLLLLQNYSCAICLNKMKNPQIDHNHQTNQTRGLLCVRCNLGLSFMEDTNFCMKSKIYLKRYNNEKVS